MKRELKASVNREFENKKVNLITYAEDYLKAYKNYSNSNMKNILDSLK